MGSEEVIEVRASGMVERPIAQVRAQYRDVDHHIRRNVHPGIKFSWVDGPSGKRLTKTEFRLLGKLQHDLTEFVDGDDGVLRLLHLEGANEGTVVEHRFTEDGPFCTRVDLVTQVPSSGVRRALGPLFRFGVRQILLKALAEDKRDLEGDGYQAGGANDIEGAVAPFLELLPKPLDPRAGRAIVKAACATSVADGTMDEAEADAIVRLASAMGGPSLRLFAREELPRARDLAPDTDVGALAHALGAELASAGVSAPGLGIAAVVAAVSAGLAHSEVAVLERIAAGAGLAPDAIESTLAQVEQALAGAR